MAVKVDQIVSMEYEVQVDGSVVDSNVGGDPLVFLTGKGKVIPGLEIGMAEMNIADKANIVVKAADAYGEYDEEAQEEVPRDQFEGIDLELGTPLQGQDADGQSIQVTVIGLRDNTVVVDFNHPLAGHDLHFSVTLLDVRDATEEEIANEGVLDA